MEIDLRSHDTRCAADFCTSICHQDCNGVGFIHNCNCIVSRKGFCTKCRHSIEMHIHTGVHYYDVTKSNRTICNEKKRKLEEALANTKNEEDRQHQIVKVLEDTSKKMQVPLFGILFKIYKIQSCTQLSYFYLSSLSSM
eukprot:TRINITY_DN312_c0_g1_i1.p1 TRINITY_DN312_c0_g1~~TRINITY_DN312_c0_g1_i1.p1  ORF type:complete len:139 (-),score=11.60 TRINITY_DN312_c0_g1_i1:106-522(-)